MNAKGGVGNYHLFGKAYDSYGAALKNEKISFTVPNTPYVGKVDTLAIKIDILRNLELQIKWVTLYPIGGVDDNYNKRNEKENPPIIAFWNAKTISITNRWKEMNDINQDLHFE